MAILNIDIVQSILVYVGCGFFFVSCVAKSVTTVFAACYIRYSA